MARLLPYRLKPGATFGVCAPSGFISQPETLDIGTLYLQERGFKVKEAPHTRGRWEYFSGTDHERLSDLNLCIRDPEVDALMAARGGYGLTRLLPMIDFEQLAQSRKPFIGFSDFTALNLALLAQTNLVSFQGPMLAPDFGHHQRSHLLIDAFEPLLFNDQFKSSLIPLPQTHMEGAYGELLKYQLKAGIEGTLWGGNLSLLTHLIGTPYLPQINQGLLFIEEVNEEPYKIERMLMQLYHAGILQQQAAILWGQFNRCEPTQASAAPYRLIRVQEFISGLIKAPLIPNLPFGHVRDKLTLPIGGHGRIELLDDRHYQLTFSQYNQIKT